MKTEDPKTWEQINKTKTVYLAYDCESNPTLITDNIRRTKSFCRENNQQFSEYLPGTYTGDNNLRTDIDY